ncbi:di-heme oxidoredictase family protein [Urbifossiella limnaea]|uniref:Cytochrome c n=1 Tax=Urbifossiella limnaea TaxID=2528023 RepID=A0A517XUJ4_9BACT|nr:di-heme oxidoredictase family protein [Urbifossiella limnaea]QDU21156.1 Cytochrome c [Urbifossiella limnaea]
MSRLSPSGQRKVFGLGMVVTAVAVGYWTFFSDGLPIWRGPSASASEIAAGRELFEREWSANDPMARGDGLGPVFNARSCAACHFQGGLGGGGANEHNALGFEVLPRPGDHTFRSGTIHNFSTNPAVRETIGRLSQIHPTVTGSTTVTGTPDCQRTITVPDFNPVRTQPVQATALFGAGWIDLISDRAILRNARNRGVQNAVRELSLQFDDIPVGKVRHVAGGVGKFGWRGQFHTLSEFVSVACANELGLGTPDNPQAQPFTSHSPASEPDLDRTQVRQLVAFVKTLPRPIEADGGAHAARGRQLFGEIGCAACHVPDLGGVTGVYSDFLLYVMEDPVPSGGRGGSAYDPAPPELNLPGRPGSETEPNEWKTPPLWGVADSAPYWHDGTAPSLKDAVLKHRGNGKAVSERFKKLPAADQESVLAFLGTLKAPPDAQPLRNSAVTRLARK